MEIIMSKEEELESRKEDFKEIRKGTIFDLGLQRFFIASKVYGKKVDAIELDESLLHRTKVKTIHFDDMGCLNIRKQTL